MALRKESIVKILRIVKPEEKDLVLVVVLIHHRPEICAAEQLRNAYGTIDAFWFVSRINTSAG